MSTKFHDVTRPQYVIPYTCPHWNGNVILRKFSSLAAPKVVESTSSEVVKSTSSGGTNHKHFIKYRCIRVGMLYAYVPGASKCKIRTNPPIARSKNGSCSEEWKLRTAHWSSLQNRTDLTSEHVTSVSCSSIFSNSCAVVASQSRSVLSSLTKYKATGI